MSSEKGNPPVTLTVREEGSEIQYQNLKSTSDGSLKVLLVAEVDGSPGTYASVKVDASGYLLTKAAP